MDFIIVLHNYKAVKTFCSRMHFSLGAGCSAAAGPVGRVLEADLRTSEKGSGMCYTYSCSKGISLLATSLVFVWIGTSKSLFIFLISLILIRILILRV